MTIPKKILIRGHVWRVKYKNMKDCEGLCDSKSRTIFLIPGLKQRETQVFLHEFFHAILDEYGCDVLDLPLPTEEMLVNIFSLEVAERFSLRMKNN